MWLGVPHSDTPLSTSVSQDDTPASEQGVSPRDTGCITPDTSVYHHSDFHSKETQERKHNKDIAQKEFCADAYLQIMLADAHRHIQVIGIWIRETGLAPQNEEQFKSIIKRNLRPATLLKGYTDDDIISTIKALQRTEYLEKFTLETVGKYIDQIVVTKNKNKEVSVLRWEEYEQDGIKSVRPIYAQS
jgi:hypothetical protein